LAATVIRTVASGTLHKRVAIEARRTFTIIAPRQILAEGVQTADWLVSGGQPTLVNIPAEIALTLEAALTDTFAL
jgi:hypothetical protein